MEDELVAVGMRYKRDCYTEVRLDVDELSQYGCDVVECFSMPRQETWMLDASDGSFTFVMDDEVEDEHVRCSCVRENMVDSVMMIAQSIAGGDCEYEATYDDWRNYDLVFLYNDGTSEEFQGAYWEGNLPVGYEYFLTVLKGSFPEVRGLELVNATSQIWWHDDSYRKYCLVRLEDTGKEYWYSTEDDYLEVGSYVHVPFGNSYRMGTITKIEFATEANAPFDPEKVREIDWGTIVEE